MVQTASETLQFTLSGAPDGTNPFLRAGRNSAGANTPVAGFRTGARTCLRDSADQIQGMVGKADEQTAKILTGLSVAVRLMMLVREGREMFLGDHRSRRTGQSWQEREQERRLENKASRHR